MSQRFAVSNVLDREFLGLRAKLLDLAATLDRIGRGETSAADPRLVQVRQAIELLARDEPQRAERLGLLFSLPYDPQWRDTSPSA